MRRVPQFLLQEAAMLKRYHDAEMMRKKDRGMIHEDWSAQALVPSGSMRKDWPTVDFGLQDAPPMLFSGVNSQMSKDSSVVRKERSKRKF